MIPPKNIFIKSDDNELEFLETKKPPKGDIVYVYKYCKSITKMGKLLLLTEIELSKLVTNNK